MRRRKSQGLGPCRAQSLALKIDQLVAEQVEEEIEEIKAVH